MKTSSRLRYFLYLSILIVGCTTGKNALQKGNYDASVSKAVDRLKSAPRNEEAQQVLAQAYQLALNAHLQRIEEAKQSADELRWESILADYQQINQLGNEINSCPTCIAVVPNARKFVTEVTDSKYNAAAVRYAMGEKQLSENNRSSAKSAYYNFERVAQLWPGYQAVKAKIDEAYWAAVTRVVVQNRPINSHYYQISNAYFQDQVKRYVTASQRNEFVLFYDEQQAESQNVTPDQVLTLSFDDFVIGQTYVKEKVEQLKRDSVITGKGRNDRPIYSTVKATLRIFDKQIASSGLLKMTITDWKTNQVIKQQRLSGTYIWEDHWASYRGDERALTKQQLKMANRKETLPPPASAMFIEFTKPIYAQLVDEIGYFYDRY
jgi:hypothetical protein